VEVGEVVQLVAGDDEDAGPCAARAARDHSAPAGGFSVEAAQERTMVARRWAE
jgi:hypothetical protein